MKRICVICSVTFNASRSDAEVCSAKCRQKNWRNKIAKASSSPSSDNLHELLMAQEKINEQENQLKDSLLLYNSQTATISKLQAENERLLRQVGQLSSELEKALNQPSSVSGNSPSGVINIGQKVEIYKSEIRETTWSGDLQKVMTKIKGSDLPDWAKKQLQSFADQHRGNFSN